MKRVRKIVGISYWKFKVLKVHKLRIIKIPKFKDHKELLRFLEGENLHSYKNLVLSLTKKRSIPIYYEYKESITGGTKRAIKELCSYKKFTLHRYIDYNSIPKDVMEEVFTKEDKVKVNAKNKWDMTPLMYACKYGEYKTAKLLLDKGAKVNMKDNYGIIALMYACYNGYFEIAELLLEKGADPTIKDNEGKTAMDDALKMGHTKIINLLEEYIKTTNPKT